VLLLPSQPTFLRPRKLRKAQWNPAEAVAPPRDEGSENREAISGLVDALLDTNERLAAVADTQEAVKKLAAEQRALAEAVVGQLQQQQQLQQQRYIPGGGAAAGSSEAEWAQLGQLQRIEDVLLEDAYHRLGWVVRTWDRPQTVSSRKRVPILQALREDGFVAYMRIEMDSPQPYVELESAGYLWRNNVDSLFTTGQIQSNPSSWWVSQYNIADSIYTLQWTPSPLWPYKRSVEVFINNLTSVALTITSAEIIRWTTRGPPE